MSYYLWLDDERPAPNIANTIVCKSYDEFVNCIEINGLPSRISFDHYLTQQSGSSAKTGLDCAKWLVDCCKANALDLPRCGVHTSSELFGEAIKSVLREYAQYCLDIQKITIVIDNGDTFEGNITQFRDCFFSNANRENIADWCQTQGMKLEIK